MGSAWLMKIKVLIVDDEKTFADLLAERLEIRNFEVAVALSGEAAIHLIQEQDFDVVLLDVFMPGQGGIETLKKIKSIKPLIDVIMLTGHGSEEAAREGIRPGMLIMEVDKKNVSNTDDFEKAIEKAIESGRIMLLVNDGKYRQLVVLKIPKESDE